MLMRRLFFSIALLFLALAGISRAAITPYFITVIKGTNTYYVSDLILDTNGVSGLTVTNAGGGHISAYIKFMSLSNSDTVTWFQVAPGVYQATSTGASGSLTNGLPDFTALNGTNNAIRADMATGILNASNAVVIVLGGQLNGTNNLLRIGPQAVTNGLPDATYVNGQGFVTKTVTNGLPDTAAVANEGNAVFASAIAALNGTNASIRSDVQSWLNLTNTSIRSDIGGWINATNALIIAALNATNNAIHADVISWLNGTNASLRIGAMAVTNGLPDQTQLTSTSNTLATATATAQSTANAALPYPFLTNDVNGIIASNNAANQVLSNGQSSAVIFSNNVTSTGTINANNGSFTSILGTTNIAIGNFGSLSFLKANGNPAFGIEYNANNNTMWITETLPLIADWDWQNLIQSNVPIAVATNSPVPLAQVQPIIIAVNSSSNTWNSALQPGQANIASQVVAGAGLTNVVLVNATATGNFAPTNNLATTNSTNPNMTVGNATTATFATTAGSLNGSGAAATYGGMSVGTANFAANAGSLNGLPGSLYALNTNAYKVFNIRDYGADGTTNPDAAVALRAMTIDIANASKSNLLSVAYFPNGYYSLRSATNTGCNSVIDDIRACSNGVRWVFENGAYLQAPQTNLAGQVNTGFEINPPCIFWASGNLDFGGGVITGTGQETNDATLNQYAFVLDGPIGNNRIHDTTIQAMSGGAEWADLDYGNSCTDTHYTGSGLTFEKVKILGMGNVKAGGYVGGNNQAAILVVEPYVNVKDCVISNVFGYGIELYLYYGNDYSLNHEWVTGTTFDDNIFDVGPLGFSLANVTNEYIGDWVFINDKFHNTTRTNASHEAHLTILGGDPTGSPVGLPLKGFIVANCEFSKKTPPGLGLDGGLDDEGRTVGGVIEGNTFDGFVYGLYLNYTHSQVCSVGLSVLGNSARNCTNSGSGGFLIHGNYSTNVVFGANSAVNCAIGLDIEGSTNITVQGGDYTQNPTGTLVATSVNVLYDGYTNSLGNLVGTISTLQTSMLHPPQRISISRNANSGTLTAYSPPNVITYNLVDTNSSTVYFKPDIVAGKITNLVSGAYSVTGSACVSNCCGQNLNGFLAFSTNNGTSWIGLGGNAILANGTAIGIISPPPKVFYLPANTVSELGILLDTSGTYHLASGGDSQYTLITNDTWFAMDYFAQ